MHKRGPFHFQSLGRPETTTLEEWSQWQWQMRRSLRSAEDFKSKLTLKEDQTQAFERNEIQKIFRAQLTPYYSRLIESVGPPLAKIGLPSVAEFQPGAQQMLDPLAEKRNSPVPRLLHRYSDRALLLVTDMCSVYCRYCTRKHFTGQDQLSLKEHELDLAIEYLAGQKGVREVLISGGDPLTLGDEILFRILRKLRAIEHIEVIRIGTRMPVVCPMRITDSLVQGLREFQPIFLMTHFNHPKEITAEAAIALEKLVDAGLPVFNQMVFLNGVNNHPAIVQALNRRLLVLRVKPYYMFQCDPSQGTDHLRTSVEESEQIVRELWGHLSGLAMASHSVDIPNGGGKTTLVPNFIVRRDAAEIQFRGWDGVEGIYKNPLHAPELPSDFTDYEGEWKQLQRGKEERRKEI